MKREPLTSRDDARDEIRQYERMLRIDEHALDEALVQQPDTFYRVSRALALAISRRDQAKTELQEVESGVESVLRRDNGVHGDKMTVSEIQANVRLDRTVRKAQAELHALNLEVGQWSALKEAFTQRSYAIKDLVGLWIASYYTDAQQGSAGRQQKEVHANKNREGMAKLRRERQ